MSPVLLLSNWYSGATLFSFLLDSHPELVCNGETFPLIEGDKRRNICSCGEYIDTCEFYKKTTKIEEGCKFPRSWDYANAVVKPNLHKNRLFNKYLMSPCRDTLLRKKLIECTNIRKKIDKYLKYNLDFMQSALRYNSSSIYIDGTKSIRRAQIFAHYSDIKSIKLIFLIRDGRAFCNSYRKNRNISAHDLIVAAKEWNQYIHLVDELDRSYRNIQMLTVRYEDLCNKKDAVFNRIKNFLGLDPFSSFESDTLPSHILGNRMRKSFSFDIQQDNSWKAELSISVVSKIESIMLRNLIRYNFIE